jgi:hypothetical protein
MATTVVNLAFVNINACRGCVWYLAVDADLTGGVAATTVYEALIPVDHSPTSTNAAHISGACPIRGVLIYGI